MYGMRQSGQPTPDRLKEIITLVTDDPDLADLQAAKLDFELAAMAARRGGA